MHQSVIDIFARPFSVGLEGEVRSMYVDVKGLVTTAIGCLIDPVEMATALPWYHEKTGQPATSMEVRNAWYALKAQRERFAKLHWKYAAALNDLRITPETLDAVVRQRFLANETVMRKAFHHWDDFCADAQLACSSMAWAVGAGFTAKFPNFTKHVNAGDWLAAKAACTIRTEGNPGVVPRNTANRLCLDNAQTVQEVRLDPSVLYWPNAAPRTRTLKPWPGVPYRLPEDDSSETNGA